MTDDRPWVLFVDDDADVRDALEGLAEAYPIRVAKAASAEEALEVIQQGPPSLLLTDYSMGDMTGWDVILEGRKIWPLLPCVLLTGGNVMPEPLIPPVKVMRKPPSESDVQWLENALQSIAQGRDLSGTTQ